jgi:hypothetical protein
MAKYLVLWECENARLPIDTKERSDGWQALMGMVKKDMQDGVMKDWGGFVGEVNGYCVMEGTEAEISIRLQQYVPFVTFKVHATASTGQVDEVHQAMMK